MIRPITLNRNPEVQRGYRLPFVNKEVQISQGNNGPWSHFAFEVFRDPEGEMPSVNWDLSFSVDFAVPLGTRVLAARDCVIKASMNRSKQCYEGTDLERGLRTLVNWIFVDHEDGTSGCYSHLASDSIWMKNGTRIKQGQPIARTGRSGWIGPTPHLHFCVIDDTVRDVGLATLPVVFEDYQKTLEHSEIFGTFE